MPLDEVTPEEIERLLGSREKTPELERLLEDGAREIGPRFLVAMTRDGLPVTERVARAAAEHRHSAICPCAPPPVRPAGANGKWRH